MAETLQAKDPDYKTHLCSAHKKLTSPTERESEKMENIPQQKKGKASNCSYSNFMQQMLAHTHKHTQNVQRDEESHHTLING